MAFLYRLTYILLVALYFPVLSNISLLGNVPEGFTTQKMEKEYQRITAMLSLVPHEDSIPVAIHFYSSARAQKTKYPLPDWGVGAAIGFNEIVVFTDKKPFLEHNLYQTTVHEMVHIVLNRQYPKLNIPRWFHEGVAMTLSGEASEREAIVVSRALFMGSLMPLASIDSVNSFGRFRAELAYSQSRLVVDYLIDTYGIELLGEILSAAQQSGSFWAGVKVILQHSEPEIEAYYRKHVLTHHGKFLWLLDQYLFWIGILFLFLIGYVVTRYRLKRKKEALAKLEELESLNTVKEDP